MRAAILLFSILGFVGCADEGPADYYISTTEGSRPVGDTLIVVEPSSIESNPEYLTSGREHDLDVGERVRVVGKETPDEETYFRVHQVPHSEIKGWLDTDYALSSPEYYQSLRENGHHIMVTSQAFGKGSSNEIILSVEFANISQERRTVESGSLTWKLFDRSGNPVSTDTHSSTIEVTLSSSNLPVPPDDFISSTFYVGYGPEGTCAELHKIELDLGKGKHIESKEKRIRYEGESLQDVAREAKNVRLKGEC
ncbi:hypothetical protein GGP51_003126 [Salinibacter ruber]|uniref:hypothetical protein n=1 Tax=Salinibacter ruber TaxID=146919 RepID=UPI002167CAE0|nr:hypothetical protein [Salinibacter ruber]MCS4034862.1 hypothetical protein [Salinibacter ruber]MCS4191630.1 hypothetical protein [Salinibacter ruber]